MKANKVKLLALMAENGFSSRKELAKAIGVSTPTVCKVINGGGGSMETFKKIADCLQCSITDFLEE